MEKTDEEKFNAFKKEFSDIKDLATGMMPQMEKFGEQFKTILANQKAIESKNIQIKGVDCVALLFEDHVTIQFAASDQAKIHYHEIMWRRKVKMFDWWKQMFKW